MNHLNSVLLEGIIVAVKAREGMVELAIANERTSFNREGRDEEMTIVMRCIAYGEMAGKAGEILKDGMQVRIVGRLAIVESQLVILIEHLEYKSSKKSVEVLEN